MVMGHETKNASDGQAPAQRLTRIIRAVSAFHDMDAVKMLQSRDRDINA
jgi:hypothetical protein